MRRTDGTNGVVMRGRLRTKLSGAAFAAAEPEVSSVEIPSGSYACV
jgi:hypothetical protein